MTNEHANRYMVRCCYCKQTFAIEGVAPWQMSHTEALAVVESHARGCVNTGKRLEFRSYGRVDRRPAAAHDTLTADWKVTQVRGTYKADVRCNGKCTHAKGGDCQCECGGRNHGTGLVLQTLEVTA